MASPGARLQALRPVGSHGVRSPRCVRWARIDRIPRARPGPEGDEVEPTRQKEDLILEPDAKVLFVACLTGLWTGSGVVGLNKAIHLVEDSVAHVDWHGFFVPEALAVPVLGGATVSLAKVAVGKEGGGRLKPIVDSVLAAVTLGTGFSLGPEGPSVDIGKSLAKSFRRAVPGGCYTALLAAGSAAGISAGFNAPISGVFFALETVLERESMGDAAATRGEPPPKEALDLAVVTLASVLAAIVSQIGLGSEPAMTIPEYRLGSYLDFPLYLVLGFLSGGVSQTFTKSVAIGTDWVDGLLAARGVGREVLPVLGGVAVGAIAMVSPEVTYQGFQNFNRILLQGGDFTIPALGLICVSKILATSISRASGLTGGLYAPTLFLGAVTGSLYGKLLDNLLAGTQLESLVAGQESFALVGMASTLAAVCRVPLTSTLLLFELTRDYGIVLPTLGGVALSFLFVSSSEKLEKPQQTLFPTAGAAAEARESAKEAAAVRAAYHEGYRDCSLGKGNKYTVNAGGGSSSMGED